jgi:hypothetical protein
MLIVEPMASGFCAQYGDGPLVCGRCPLQAASEVLLLALMALELGLR